MPFVKRFLLALFALIALEVMAAPPAFAAGAPQRLPLLIPPTGTFSGLCAFDVNYSVVVNTEYNIVFFDNAGNPIKAITEGRLVVTFTNAANGNHLTLNISGPGTTTFNPDGSQRIVFLGNGVLFTGDDIVYNTGRVVIVAPDPLSPGTIVSASGIQRSLCAMLA
jgi:hypothetical protein